MMSGKEEQHSVPAKGGSRRVTARRMAAARKITMGAVFAAVIASLAFDCGIGTPSSFGVGRFNLLCPLGGLEAMVASKSFIPVAAISAGVLLVFALAFGRAWCAWGCPVHSIRRFFKREPKAENACMSSCAGVVAAFDLRASVRYIARDGRTWVFVAVLIAALIAGFPLFCLVCPIGLTFGTVGSLWHLIVDKQMTVSVLVFPVALAIEVVLFRKWCLNVCPVAGLLGIFGQFARRARPQVNTQTCLRCAGRACEACTAACPEQIDLHAPDATLQLGACMRCGECVKSCPTDSISIRL